MKLLKFRFWTLIAVAVMLFACHTKRTVETVPEMRVELGYMNQKSGSTNTYILSDDGQLYQKSTMNNNYVSHKKVKDKEAETIFKTVDQLKQSNSTTYKIGEETYFVRFRQGVDLQEWKWDVNDPGLPEELKNLNKIFKKIFEEED